MEIDARRLRILLTVARRGGVTRAAEALHLTPSAVSQQLGQLEREVGVALVDRSQRRAGLTPAGRLLAARAERIEAELAEARAELERFTGRITGSVTLLSFGTAIRYLLLPAIALMSERHPQSVPSVHEQFGDLALERLRLGDADMAVAERDAAHPVPPRTGLVTHPLLDDEFRVVVPAAWGRTPHAIAELADAPWVGGPPDSAIGQALVRLGRGGGFTPRRAHQCVEFPVVLAMVAAGHGASIVPSLALRGPVSPDITVTPIGGVGARSIEAVVREGGEPIVAAMLQAIKDVAAGR